MKPRTTTTPWAEAIEDQNRVAEGNHDFVGASEAWRRKMALLEEIHEQISPQLAAMRMAEEDMVEPEDFLDRDELNPARQMCAIRA